MNPIKKLILRLVGGIAVFYVIAIFIFLSIDGRYAVCFKKGKPKVWFDGYFQTLEDGCLLYSTPWRSRKLEYQYEGERRRSLTLHPAVGDETPGYLEISPTRVGGGPRWTWNSNPLPKRESIKQDVIRR